MRAMRSRSRPGLRPAAPIPRGVRLFDPATLARLCRARDYLASRFTRRASLADAAREADLSPFYFNRLFTQAFDETPHEFVTRLRIDQARRLLLADNDSVTGICWDVGYESLGSFSTRFRTLTGLSPNAFRREARRLFAGFGSGRRWPLFYIPACFQVQHSLLPEPQEPRSIASSL
jgi:AraC-like DNA-binding protein